MLGILRKELVGNIVSFYELDEIMIKHGYQSELAWINDEGLWDDKYPYGKPQTDEVARGSGNREYGCRRLREKLPNFSGVSFF